MTVIVKANNEYSVLINYKFKGKEFNVDSYSIINTNYSLIRYLTKLLDINSIYTNKDGYVCLKRKDGTTSSLQRIIMEFYSEFDDRIKTLLKEKYEVDHINNIKTDNRVDNFQVLKHQDNILKIYNNRYQVAGTNEHILELDNKIKNLKQYKTDEKKLKRQNGKFNKVIKRGNFKNISECCYLDLYSKSNRTSSNYPESIETVIYDSMCYIKNNSTNNCTNILYELYQHKNNYITCKLLNNNLRILNRYRLRYNYLNEIIMKYNILNNKYNYKINNNIDIYDLKYNLNLRKSKQLLYDLYQEIILKDNYTINNGTVLKSIDISFEVDKIGKYTDYRIMFILGLLKREKSKDNKTFFSIPIYTDELLRKANVRAKKIIELNWRKVRFFGVIEEFGEDIAKEVYKEKFDFLYGMYNEYSKRAKEDIIKFVINNKKIKEYGFITIGEILSYIVDLNEKRKENCLFYNPIHKNFDVFIKDLLKTNTYTIKEMEKLGYKYVSLNKSIIKNIKEYMKYNNLDNENMNLYSKKRVIVLKQLIK